MCQGSAYKEVGPNSNWKAGARVTMSWIGYNRCTLYKWMRHSNIPTHSPHLAYNHIHTPNTHPARRRVTVFRCLDPKTKPFRQKTLRQKRMKSVLAAPCARGRMNLGPTLLYTLIHSYTSLNILFCVFGSTQDLRLTWADNVQKSKQSRADDVLHLFFSSA